MFVNRISGYYEEYGRNDPAPSVHDAIAHHQEQGDWDRREAAVWLNRLKGYLVEAFKIQVGDVVIGVAKLPVKVSGHYKESHNALGVEREILISAQLIDAAGRDRQHEVAGALLHELLHAEQASAGRQAAKPGRHNKAYRNRARALGLIVREDGAQGYAAGGNRLFCLLYQLGVSTPDLVEDLFPEAVKPRGKSTLHKYICRCPKPQTFRSGRRDFRALCPECTSQFEIKE